MAGMLVLSPPHASMESLHNSWNGIGHFDSLGNLEPRHRPSRSRACEACARKKVRCDMRLPVCSLCDRIGNECLYPTRRKQHTRRKQKRTVNSDQNARNGAEAQSVPRGEDEMSSEAAMGWRVAASSQPQTQEQSTGEQQQLTQSMPMPILEGGGDIGSDMFFGISLSPLEQDLPFSIPIAGLAATPDWREGQMSVSGHSSAEDSTVSSTGFLSRLFNDESLDTTVTDASKKHAFSIHIPPHVADHLLEVYFEKVQPSTPLLHRSKTLASIAGPTVNSEQGFTNLDLESALLLNSMFALAARFSEETDFWDCAPRKRGEQFAKKAQFLCDLVSQDEEESHLTLRCLQGCILLTYYHLSSRPSFQAWSGVGLCCRLAYALLIHQVDRDTELLIKQGQLSDEEWSYKEEQRRAWWMIFQMDNFASVTGGRPFNLDMGRAEVWLPVSDEAWFNLQRVKSAPICGNGPATAWETLLDCENQDAYAWYLVCNYLIRTTQEEFEKRIRSRTSLEIIQSAIHCFHMSLPANLSLRPSNMNFNRHNFGEKNWIVSTHFLIHGAQITVGLGLCTENSGSPDTDESRIDTLQNPNQSLNVPVRNPALQRSKDLRDQIDVVRLWSPEFIPLASPLLTAALFISNAAYAFETVGDESDTSVLARLDGKLLELVIRRYSDYWDIGRFCLDLLKAWKAPDQAVAIRAMGNRTTWFGSILKRAQFLRDSSLEYLR